MKGVLGVDDSASLHAQQEITGNTIAKPNNMLDDFIQPQQKPLVADPFDLGNIVGPPVLPTEQNPIDLFATNQGGLGDIMGPPQLDARQNPDDLFGDSLSGLVDVVGAPQVSLEHTSNDLFNANQGVADVLQASQSTPEQNQNNLFGANHDLFSTPTPPPRNSKKVVAIAASEESSSEDDADTPHFKYPYGDDKDLTKRDQVAPVINGVDLFGSADFSNEGSSNVKSTQKSVDLFGLDAFTDPVVNKSESFPGNSAQVAATNSADPFDLFAAPTIQGSASNSAAAKDPFDLFA